MWATGWTWKKLFEPVARTTQYRHPDKSGTHVLLKGRKHSGGSRHWVKAKYPAAPAVKREAEEDWGKDRWR